MSLEVHELTPRGAGAVSVLALRGPGALERVRALAPRARLLPGRPVLVRLRAAGEELDLAVVCVLGPEAVELHLHASPPLVRRVARELAGEGGAPAEEPRAAVEELAAEALARAPCESAARILLDQAEGALRRDVLAACGRADPAERRAALALLLERGRLARWALRPAEVVLAGPVNAGKSTLFNVLLGERRALVGDEPGTTRDWIREPAQLGAWPIYLSDTAGERPLASGAASGAEIAVERAGQALARAARERADLVLWLAPLAPGARPAGLPARLAPRGRAVLLHTQADRLGARERRASTAAVSALHAPEAARAVVLGAFRAALDLPADPWLPGAGVPFRDDQVAALGRLRALEQGAEPAARAWLDGAGGPLVEGRPEPG